MKVVSQNRPTYIMSAFKIQITLCKLVHQIKEKFWWASNCDKIRNSLTKMEQALSIKI